MSDEDKKLEALFQELFEQYMERFPTYATYMGYKHDKYDHLLPDSTLEARRTDILESIKTRKKLETINYAELSDNSKLDYDLIEYFIDLEFFEMTELAAWTAGATAQGPIGEIGSALYLLYVRDYAPVETRVKAMISRLKATPRYLEDSKSLWLFPVKLWTEIAMEEGPRTIGFLQLIQQTLKPQLRTEVHQELVEAISGASKAIETYADWIQAEILPRATHDWVIGPQKFARLVALRKIGKTPEEILQVGEKALKDTKIQLKELANELYPGKAVEEVREIIKEDHPPSFEMVLEHVAELTKESRSFVIDHDLMDVPEGETLQVIPTPAFLVPIIPFAAYLSPEKFAKDQIGVYIVTPSEGNDEMLKEHSYASCRNTAVHEGYPGHHLQLTSGNLQPSLVRSIVNGIETVEGWAHYCEQLMAEKGFLDKREIFVQLVDQLWRAVRIIVDIKLSTGQMTFEEAKKMMMEEIGMAETGVVAELRRYTANPGYQFSYLLGKFMLLELRDEIKEKMGNRYSDKFFHNTILQNGGLPIHYLRKLFNIKVAEAS
ncbi:MAG: DUF885 domain-containing protein [Candidatus Heimdallarchaeota archaeon]